MSPSGSEVNSRMAPTRAIAKIDPVARPMTSIALPMWATSAMPTLTTSPVARRLGSVAPRRAACRLVTWTVRYAAPSQLPVANRCRITPATAWIAPSSASTPHHSISASGSFGVTPVSMARPIVAGISAWLIIHSTPHAAPPAIERAWRRATHSRKRAGERWSGTPGPGSGKERMGVPVDERQE